MNKTYCVYCHFSMTWNVRYFYRLGSDLRRRFWRPGSNGRMPFYRARIRRWSLSDRPIWRTRPTSSIVSRRMCRKRDVVGSLLSSVQGKVLDQKRNGSGRCVHSRWVIDKYITLWEFFDYTKVGTIGL